MKDIVQRDNEVLRQVAEYIRKEDIQSEKIQKVITEMHRSLATQKDGVALAAPQIAESLQIFVIAPFVFEDPEAHPRVYINPEITWTSKGTKMMHEGCLSCRWTVGDVLRHTEVEVEAYNEKGEKFSVRLDGLLAHIAQHEIDHLHGTLFIDKAENMREMTDEEIAEVK